jgi:predicted RNA-binding protein with PIN domain
MRVLVVDGANVIGSRPDGWWKDRPGAARRLHDKLLQADLDHDEVVLVLEGAAKPGVRAGRDLHVLTVHAPRDGDSAIVALVADRAAAGDSCTVVTADRVLGGLVSARGAHVSSPSYLLDSMG